MSQNLVIVESPAKARTIAQFLGSVYEIQASMGHIWDLPKSKMGIDLKGGTFEPTYLVPQDKKRVLKELKSKISPETLIWIATDVDREGEAIGWHLVQALKIKDLEKVKRIVFHEITKKAILEAIESPRGIDLNLVEAQKARRVLDRLVGYELSPLLWKKVRYGLSAGRVQSVAVRLVVEKEKEIKAFKVEEYWKILGRFLKKTKPEFEFEAVLIQKGEEKIDLKNQKEVNEILKNLEGSAYLVKSVERKEVSKTPAPPFITSTLQQEAFRKLRMSVKKTMLIAQQLYEGVNVGAGEVGLITYMRTDSFNLSEEFLKNAREMIKRKFGSEYALSQPRRYKSRKGAQEAHEAIRPVDLNLKPDQAKNYLTKDQYRLYELIWKRALASQMEEAIFDKVTVDVEAKGRGYLFRAAGQTIKFPGFIRVYVEGRDQPEEELEEKEKILPELKNGEEVSLKELAPKQSFTKPPARYTEAALVKKLEAEGIGRPSTYAPIISTILLRGYVEKEDKFLKPTDTGEVVTDVLVKHFPEIVDLGFTAEMEEDLDKIAAGEKNWHPLIKEFYEPFHQTVQQKQIVLDRKEIVTEESKEICEKCGAKMVIKLGKFGKFLSCSNYPKCKNARSLKEEVSETTKELKKKLAGKKCEKCGAPMEIKKGKYGEFLGCSGYPQCKHMLPLIKFTGIKCPKCGKGQLVERQTRKTRKIFYGCNKFPKCRFAAWNKPSKEETPVD